MTLFIKRLICKLGLAAKLGLIEFCFFCGREQPLVWWSADSLWHAVDEGRNMIYCPECFDREALKRGFLIRWVPTVHAASTRQL